MRTIDEKIEENKDILNDPQISRQRRRYLEQELEQLESYKRKHPDRIELPNSLELFCDENPDAVECRIYND